MNIKSLLKNRTLKNAGWLIGGKIAQMAISFIVGMLTARYLGPSNYGLINYAGAYTAFFTSFCTLGINSILVKEFLEHPENEGVIIGSTLVLRSMSSLLSAVVIICISMVADANDPTAIAIVVLSCIGMVFHVFDTLNYRFQAQLRSKVTATVTFIAYCITALYKIILLILGKSVIWFAFATSVDYICIAIMLLIAYRKYDGKRFSFSWSYSKKLLSQSYHFIFSGLMVAIYGHTDKLMLKHMMSETEVGYYSTATAVCSMWCFVLSAIIDSVYPSIMEANGKNEALFVKRNKQLYAIVFYISIGVSVLFMLFAPLVIRILYGEQYMPAVTPLRIVTWYTAFSYLGVARNAWLVCKGRQKHLKYIYTVAAILNVILNLIFIPLWGAAGAAIASLISQILTSIVLPLFMKGLRENSVMMIEAICLKNVFDKE